MKILSASAAIFIFSIATFTPPAALKEESKPVSSIKHPSTNPKIQAAILLDVSGSMSGLIEQAKAQLWNMVSVMGRAKCENGIPKIEIALYIYGQGDPGKDNDYIKQVAPFSSDLDNLSQELFKLTTTGSAEYCGQVIYTSLNELSWDSSSTNYKVIFIAGNESFLQGKTSFTVACAAAMKKGVIVNTIYCGDRMTGIRESWSLNGECGNGSYTNINHNASVRDIPTPYDTTLTSLNSQLNSTYLYYGAAGASGYAQQRKVDQLNYSMDKSVAAKRTAAKAKSNLYQNESWDLVDANRADSTLVAKVDMKTLPDSLKNISREQLQKVVVQKNNERLLVQQQIATVSNQRETYIAAERAKNANNKETTLETEVERIIKEQVKRFNMVIE
jgi:hypothetical protein